MLKSSPYVHIFSAPHFNLLHWGDNELWTPRLKKNAFKDGGVTPEMGLFSLTINHHNVVKLFHDPERYMCREQNVPLSDATPKFGGQASMAYAIIILGGKLYRVAYNIYFIVCVLNIRTWFHPKRSSVHNQETVHRGIPCPFIQPGSINFHWTGIFYYLLHILYN